MIKVKVTEIRTAILTLDPKAYPEDCNTADQMIEYEKEGFYEVLEYMDNAGADSVVTFEVLGETE